MESYSNDPSPYREESSFGPIKKYFNTLISVCFNPTEFFKTKSLSYSLQFVFLFALITDWVSKAVQYVWNKKIWESYSPEIQSFLAQIQTPQYWEAVQKSKWFWDIGNVLLAPFFMMIQILLSGAICFVSARILVPQNEEHSFTPVTFERVVRILCFSSAASVFLVIPWFGPLIASILTFIYMMIGIQHIFHVSKGRSIFILLFPTLVTTLVMFSLVAGFAFLLYKIFHVASGQI